MSFFARLGYDIVSPLIALWDAFINSLPGVLGGILILIFGYLLGEVLELLIIRGLHKIKFNKFIHSFKISKNLEKFDVSHFIGVLIKWYVFVIFLAPAASIAKMGTLSILLLDLARWVPHFLVAVLIVVFGWLAADVMGTRVEATKVKSKHMASLLVKTFIMVFVLVIALDQLKVNLTLLHETYVILLSAIAFGVALAIGIGFGLAMKDDAKKVIKNIRKKL